MEIIGAEGETPTPSAYFFKKFISGFRVKKNQYRAKIKKFI